MCRITCVERILGFMGSFLTIACLMPTVKRRLLNVNMDRDERGARTIYLKNENLVVSAMGGPDGA